MAGTYAVTITDDHGCMRDTSITLIEPDSALTTVLAATDVACNGSLTGSINATVKQDSLTERGRVPARFHPHNQPFAGQIPGPRPPVNDN